MVACLFGCGSGSGPSGAEPSSGGTGNASGGTPGAGGLAQVDAAVSAAYRYSECGQIDASARPVDATYAPDGSILVLEETGRLRLFPEGSNSGTTLIPAPTGGGATGFGLSSDGLSLVMYDAGGRTWYGAADLQPIGAGTAELVRIDSPAEPVVPAGAVAESCAEQAYVTDSNVVMTADSDTVCVWESETGPLLGRYDRGAGRSDLVLASAFANDGFFTLDQDQLIHVDLGGEVAASFDLTGLFLPGIESNWQASFDPSARTLVLAFLHVEDGVDRSQRFVALDTLSGNVLWDVTFGSVETGPVPSFRFDPEGSVVLVEQGPILSLTDGAVVGHDVSALGAIVALTPGARRELRIGEQVGDWDLEQQRVRQLYGSHTLWVGDVDVSPDGRHFASHGDWAVTWEVAPDFSRSLPLFHGAAADESWYAALDPSGSTMTVSGDNIALFTRSGAGQYGPPPAAGPCWSSAVWAFSPTGPWAAGTHYGRLEVYDTRTLELAQTLPASNCGGAVAFSPDGSKLVTASLELFETEGWTKLWGPGDARPDTAVVSEGGVAFSPDAQEVTATRCRAHNQECRATRYSAIDGALIAEVPELDGERIQYSPEGHWLVSKGRLFHIPTGTTLTLAEDVEVASFTPEGDLIAGVRDGSIRRYCRETPASP